MKITWIAGHIERQLLDGLDGVELIPFKKNNGFREIIALRKQLASRRFDALLHMQTSLRSNLIALFVPAEIKIGYDESRARELHRFVVSHTISVASRQHQVDDFLDFVAALGVPRAAAEWRLHIPQAARDFAAQQLLGAGPWLAINAASSPSKRVYRNWPADRYAQVINAVQQRGISVVLLGGPTEYEKQIAQEIVTQCIAAPLDLVGKTTLKQVAAVLARADLLLTSDSGPAHIATAVGTPVIALHAATNPYQTGPYLDLDRVINYYPQAIAAEYAKSPEQLPWGIRAHGERVMEAIGRDEVIAAVLHYFTGQGQRHTSIPSGALTKA